MNPNAAKAFTSFLISIMSFLGWDTSSYTKYLPKEIKSQIILELPPVETVATSTKVIPKKSTTPKKITPAQTTKPIVVTKKSSASPLEGSTAYSPGGMLNSTSSVAVATPPSREVPTPTSLNLSLEGKINLSAVNILCSMRKGNLIQQFTGSGVIIDPSGVILTNAHVAEHVMLAESGYETCNIRTGSPAHNSYKAKIIYLPDIWISNNRNNLQMQSVTGTGENDYALLAITERTSASAPNVPLPYLPLSDKSPSSGDAIILAGYPAGFGDASLLDSALYFLQKTSQISGVLGFFGNGNDVIDTAATSLAVRGSSGGAMVASDGTLIGIMDSVVTDNFSGGNAIQGISINYIKNSIQNTLGKSLQSLVDNAQAEANNFEKNKVQTLSAMLVQ